MKESFKTVFGFFKTHKILAIILATVIFFVALWTPVIIVLSNQTDNKQEAVSSGGSSQHKGSSVFIASGTPSNTQTQASGTEEPQEPKQSDSQEKNNPSGSSEQESSDKQESSGSSSVKTPITDSQNKPVTPKDPIPQNAPRIICWGDSITSGMGVADGADYPAVLQRLIGNNYRVLNAGSSGEQSQTIAARQGAYEVILDKDVVFEAGYGSAYLDGGKNPQLVLSDGTPLDINEDGEDFRNDLPCKKVYIDGKEYELSVSSKKLELIREEYDTALTIKKGSKVVFESANSQKGSYCEIFYIGANDGLSGKAQDIEYLINRYKAMINRQGNDCYMVIIPQWSSGFTEAFKAEFGDKAVDLRSEMCLRVINSVDIRPTSEDIKQAENNKIPASLKYNNNPNDSLHFNVDGYKMMAQILYDRGVKLGYWK